MALRFEELLDRHHDEIFSYLWRLMGNQRRHDGALEIEDLVQDVFLRAYQGFTNLRPNSNHRAWLYKIATNCAYTRLRSIKRRQMALESSIAELAPPSDCSRYSESAESRLRFSVNALPEKQKLCVTLRYLQGFSYPEIAQIAGCSQQAVRANVYQAIRRLRIALREAK
jgi:RNA polymerase sigma-70 factor (ECF subfamily)